MNRLHEKFKFQYKIEFINKAIKFGIKFQESGKYGINKLCVGKS